MGLDVVPLIPVLRVAMPALLPGIRGYKFRNARERTGDRRDFVAQIDQEVAALNGVRPAADCYRRFELVATEDPTLDELDALDPRGGRLASYLGG